jgi:mRNA-degrading endonuclease RelE of RelBE toxin-antitoxin system
MNYKVEAIPNFKKEAKRLIKKFRSLKDELAELASFWKTNHILELLLEMTVIKYVYLLKANKKVKQEEQG